MESRLCIWNWKARSPKYRQGQSGSPHFCLSYRFYAEKYLYKVVMRHQGKLTNWKDEKGFGFIVPKEGGGTVFVHVRDFANRKRRPIGNEDVTYELGVDPRGRAHAKLVEFNGDKETVSRGRGRGWVSIGFACVFLVTLSAAAYAGRLPIFVTGLYLGGSVVAFIAYAVDKSAARNDRWRIQESTLQLFGLIGGWPGALIAQRLLRHKSRKFSFQITFWITVMLNCGVLTWFYVPQGSNAMRAIWRTITSTSG